MTMTRREEILDILMTRTPVPRSDAESIADAILALPPVEARELVKELTDLHGECDGPLAACVSSVYGRAASALTQQEAEIARLRNALDESCEDQRFEYAGCARAEKAEAERDELQRKLDDARKALEWIDQKVGLGSDVYDRIRAALSQKDEAK